MIIEFNDLQERNTSLTTQNPLSASSISWTHAVSCLCTSGPVTRTTIVCTLEGRLLSDDEIFTYEYGLKTEKHQSYFEEGRQNPLEDPTFATKIV